MAQKAQVLDLTRSYLPRDPTSMAENLVSTDKEDGEEKSLPVVPYEGYNFLPTSYGYRSYFGLQASLTAIALITSKVDKILSFQLTDYTNKLIALCSDGIWLYDATATTWTKVQALTDNSGISQYDEWTYSVIENNLYMYRQGNSVVYKYTQAGVLTNFAPTFLNMAGQVGIFRARGRLGFWDSANSIAWSAADDLTNCTPSLETLAGNTIFSAIIGRIVTVKPQGDGFLIYCTKSIVGVGYDVSGSMIWSAQSLKDSTGVATSDDVTQGQNSEEHYVRTNTGFYFIGAFNPISNSRKVESIIPELWDLLKERDYPIKMDCLYDRYLYISTTDDTYINAKISQVSQTIPALDQPLLKGGYYYTGSLPAVLDAGQITNYLSSLFNGPYRERQGTRYRTKRWTVTLDIVPTAFYCDWDKSVPAGRSKWNNLSALSASVSSLPVNSTRASSAATACLAASGHDKITGSRVITGVYANSNYKNSAVDAILGKVYCNSLHYVQEAIWDNAVKERNTSVLNVFKALTDVTVVDTWTDASATPAIPLHGTTTVFGTLADGFGSVEEVENIDGTEVVLRKHFQSGWELKQTVTQTDTIVTVSGGAEDPFDPYDDYTGTLLYRRFYPIEVSATEIPWCAVMQGTTRAVLSYKYVASAVVGIILDTSFDGGTTWGREYLAISLADSDLVPNMIIQGTTLIAVLYIRYPYGVGHLVIKKVGSGSAVFYEGGSVTGLDEISERDTLHWNPNSSTYELICRNYVSTLKVHYSSDGLSWASKQAVIPAGATAVAKWAFFFVGDKYYLYYPTTHTLYSTSAIMQDPTPTVWSTVVISVAEPSFLDEGVEYLDDIDMSPYSVIAKKDANTLSVKFYDGGWQAHWLNINLTTGAAAFIGLMEIIVPPDPYIPAYPLSITHWYYSGGTYYGAGIKPGVTPQVTFFSASPSGSLYEHTQTTTYHPTYDLVSATLGISEMRFTQTHTDYLNKKRNGSIVIDHSLPVTAAAVPAWDNEYPAGIENGKDYFITKGNSRGPNPADLYNGLYGGVSLGGYISPIDSTNSSYTYYVESHLDGDPFVTFPGATFVLQNGTPAPIYPTYKGAFVYDIALKKWGKFKGDHQLIVCFNPVNSTAGGSISYTDFGMNAGIIDVSNNVKLFDAAPDDSFIRYGKIGYHRLGMTTAYEVKVHFRASPSCVMVVDTSLDGLGLEPALAREFILEDMYNTEYLNNSGRWHTISLYGKFDLQYLEFRGIIAGRR